MGHPVSQGMAGRVPGIPSLSRSDLLTLASRDAGLPASSRAVLATTGYGRRCLKIPALTFTEIATHAKGCIPSSYPGCRFVVDIGGQDAKGIRLSAEGRVEDFVMNDKCAAGTGRFLSTIGQALGCSGWICMGFVCCRYQNRTGSMQCAPSLPNRK